MSQNSAADTAPTGTEPDQKHHDDTGIGSPASSTDSTPSDAAHLRDNHRPPPATEPPRTVDPYLVDDDDLRVEHEALKAFINAPVDQARHIARYLRADDFYRPVNSLLYTAAIDARRASAGASGAEAVNEALQRMTFPTEHHRDTAHRALLQVVVADGDPADLRGHASTILHQAMRRQAVMHATRVQQILAETDPEEIFPAIERSSTAMRESRLEERYRALNDFPPAQPPRRRDAPPEAAVTAERSSASHRVAAALGAAAGASTSSRRTRSATVTALDSRRPVRSTTGAQRPAAEHGRG
ncbi:hypothetical protein FK530_23470 [Tsukamurella conjunctivitidis]|uniref:DNA helicase DnaB-like N-terminal domain-containing protein n=1 Tax=Tsukamurella conjunctivitidis TaxID=2592068 RepID=A0A5C5RQ50_9ACTN|nr:hypothetical protein [Tsukamurella conjunctivitidis]RDB48821.1 hypothetical protein DVB87_05870 [Tsukamurella tyrosinosolvens]TWS24643.1 hypothetical protein FK530_23470 [Tsukamurella conjunctivitidis]